MPEADGARGLFERLVRVCEICYRRVISLSMVIRGKLKKYFGDNLFYVFDPTEYVDNILDSYHVTDLRNYLN